MNGLNPLPNKLQIEGLIAARRVAVDRLTDERAQLDEAKATLEAVEEAMSIAQGVAAAVQANAHKAISSVVSRCLEAIFERPYKFNIIFEQKRGRTEARMVFERDGTEFDPLSSTGGGVVDVAAFGLRVACLCLARPPGRRLLLMDEPFKFVSADNRGRVCGLLQTLADELGVQIVMVTHIPEFEMGTVVQIA